MIQYANHRIPGLWRCLGDEDIGKILPYFCKKCDKEWLLWYTGFNHRCNECEGEMMPSTREGASMRPFDLNQDMPKEEENKVKCFICKEPVPECICPAPPPWVNCNYDLEKYNKAITRRMKETGKSEGELLEEHIRNRGDNG